MYYDPFAPKTPPHPPHGAHQTEAFSRTVPPGPKCSRVGFVERPVDESLSDLHFDIRPRYIPASEFLESLAPSVGRRPQPVRQVDSTKRFFQTLTLFQPADCNRRPDRSILRYSLYPKNEEPFVHEPTHRVPSRVGTVTKSCDERRRTRLSFSEDRCEKTRGKRSADKEDPDLFRSRPCRVSLRHSERTFTLDEPEFQPCQEKPQDVRTHCFEGGIKCSEDRHLPPCCRPLGGSGTQRGYPSPFRPQFLRQDPNATDKHVLKYSGIRGGIYDLSGYYLNSRDATEEKGALRSSRTLPQGIDKSLVFPPQQYYPRGASFRLGGDTTYFMTDEERFPKKYSQAAQSHPSEADTFARQSSYYARHPSHVGSALPNRATLRSKPSGRVTLNLQGEEPVTDSERPTGQKEPFSRLPPPPRKTKDTLTPSPYAREFGSRYQSTVGAIRYDGRPFKEKESVLPEARTSRLTVSRHLSKMQDPLKRDPDSQDKRGTVTRFKLPREKKSLSQKKPSERTTLITEQSSRHASRIGSIYNKDHPSKRNTLLASQPVPPSTSQKSSGKPSFYSGDKKASMVAARVLGSTIQRRASGEAPRKSKIKPVERPSIKRRAKPSTNPSSAAPPESILKSSANTGKQPMATEAGTKS